MKCKDICALLSDYLDGDLNNEIMKNMNTHLQNCNECTKKLENLERSLKILKRLRESDSPHEYLDFSV